MTARLPIPGGDAEQWGTILNVYLSQAHNADGTLQPISQTVITGLPAALASKADQSAITTLQTTAQLKADLDSSTSALVTSAGSATSVALGQRFAQSVQPTDHILFVSKNGNDSNDGRSWGSAFLTLSAALTALSYHGGTIEIGGGTFTEPALSFANNKTIRGRGRFETTIQFTTSGVAVDLTNQSNQRFESLGLAFASSSVTGTLVKMSNAFTCDFIDVRFSGTTTTSQVGVALSANAGDSHFINCYFNALDTGVRNDTTVNYFIGCVFSSNNVSVAGGDPTGATAPSGIVCNSCTFRGSGTYYINIDGAAQAWIFDGCWFDGAATTAVKVGTGTYGPWLFSMTNCPSLMGGTNSLVINAARYVSLSGIVFGNTGSNPTELMINAANCPRGAIGTLMSLQGSKLETMVPAAWKGAVGYAASGDSTVQLIETYNFMDTPNYAYTQKRVVIKIANRSTSSAQADITFPTAFETSYGGGQFYKIFDNSGIGAGVAFNRYGITIPTGVACSSGLIIIEGF